MHPLVDELLAPTYGVIVYQEQVMQIAQTLAGYTLGGADLLRRAMGKKKPEEMAKQKSIFVEGAKKKGVAEEDAERIFGLLEYFAGYGFNKSHSAAYALITYQTAYLKAHYPVEFLCAILTSDKDSIEKVVRTIADARAMGVTVLPPDVNESDTDFKVVYTHPGGDKPAAQRAATSVKDALGPQIRFGLGAVRGARRRGARGDASRRASRRAVPRPLRLRRARRRASASTRASSRRSCSAARSTRRSQARGVTRARAFASIDVALERSRAREPRPRARADEPLRPLRRGAPQATAAAPSAGDYVERRAVGPARDARARAAVARLLRLGPPARALPEGRRAASRKLEARRRSPSARAMDDWAVVKLAGMVEGYRERIFKDGGGKIAFFELEDLSGRVNVKVRGNQIDTYAHVLTTGEPVLVTGKISYPRRDDDEPEPDPETTREATVLLNDAVLLSDVVAAGARQLLLRLRADQLREGTLEQVSRVMRASSGSCPVTLQLTLDGGAEALLALGPSHRVEIGDALLAGLEKIFGAQVAELR